MPSRRRPSKHARPHVPLDLARLQGGTVREEVYRGRSWTVRSVSGAASQRAYLCPGCQQGIPLGTPHVVVWPADGIGGLGDRRHWHSGCWQRRDARPPGASYR
ncbi:hypothetical protein [Intrasporangium sp.]|uniref:hypothetical protein n=1 Tax=Intrasporangium sp. TaxID=1925024 RepID=UPI0032214962